MKKIKPLYSGWMSWSQILSYYVLDDQFTAARTGASR